MSVIKTKILLTGGGTGGSVAPLLALADELGFENFKFLWVGTRRGIEKQMVSKENIRFKAIASGKLRRYFSLRNLIDPLFIIIGFIQSFFIILKYRPNWIITAGSFVSVPVVWAGWILRRRILVHQQDVRPGLANLLMAPFANQVTVTFEKSLADYSKKATWIGNPTHIVKTHCNASHTHASHFNLKKNLLTILVLGGGTGSLFINKLVTESKKELSKIAQTIHVTGKNRALAEINNSDNYFAYEFLDFSQMQEAYQRADIVVSRCGMSTLTELSCYQKPAILIPIPDTHQIDNARIFEEYSAAVVLDQPVLEKTFFLKKIKELLTDEELQQQLSANISKIIKKNASQELAKIIKMK